MIQFCCILSGSCGKFICQRACSAKAYDVNPLNAPNARKTFASAAPPLPFPEPQPGPEAALESCLYIQYFRISSRQRQHQKLRVVAPQPLQIVCHGKGVNFCAEVLYLRDKINQPKAFNHR